MNNENNTREEYIFNVNNFRIPNGNDAIRIASRNSYISGSIRGLPRSVLNNYIQNNNKPQTLTCICEFGFNGTFFKDCPIYSHANSSRAVYK